MGVIYDTIFSEGKEQQIKKLIMIAVTLALVTLSGCSSNSERGGSVLKGEGFKIAVPTFKIEMKQGDVQSVNISIDRGESFKQDVTLKIEADNGISIDPVKVLVRGSDKPDVQLRITVPKDAAIGVYRVFVKGTPKVGEPTSTEFNVRVINP